MDFQQRFDPRNQKSLSASENSTGFCECNICLDSARDPVVTLCGHLYCWPCIYKWLHVQTSSLEFDKQQPKCPVCKTHISTSLLVPLYGRGNSSSESSEPKTGHLDQAIPSRPSGPIQQPNHQHPNPYTFQQHFQPPQSPPFPQPFGTYANFGGTYATTASFSSPIVGMFGEMVCAMIFRSSSDTTSLYAYHPHGPYQNLYPVPANGTPRVRRQVMQVEKSLNRLTIFFFCCFILCLLLF